MLYFDPMYLVFAMPALLLAFYAQFKVQSAYNKYLQVANAHRLSGVQVARRLIDQAGLYGVSLEGTSGRLSDHYDPRSKTLRLSEGVAQSASVASMAIVAHELGHAQQHENNSFLITMRNVLVPAVNFSSPLAYLCIFMSFLFYIPGLFALGILFYAVMVLFTLVTLPVEFDASRRGIKLLEHSGLMQTEADVQGSRQVLRAAALTYVAAAVAAVLQLLYYLSLAGRRRRR